MQMEQAIEAKRVKEANEMLHGLYFEDLEEGMKDAYAKTITNADIITFAGISGDTNPVHLNHEFASETMFEARSPTAC